MVVVYLKNGEKAPLPDANYVKLDTDAGGAGLRMLRCFFGEREVGLFKWDDVSGYSIDAPFGAGQSNEDAYKAWGLRPSET